MIDLHDWMTIAVPHEAILKLIVAGPQVFVRPGGYSNLSHDL